MYSFEGDFRRKPQQNLAGASAQRKTDRDALILQSQQQRQKREEHRKQLHSAIKIQAFVRSYLTRKHCKQLEREEFDNVFAKCEEENHSLLSWLLTKILFFYDDEKDCSRLVSISQLLLKQWKRVFQSGGSSIQIRRLLALHLRLLRDESKVPLAVPLRMFEVFTSTSSAEAFMSCTDATNIIGTTFLYLVKRGYFKDLRQLLCQKTPPLYGPSPNPPTPLCGALLDLIQRPLHLPQINVPEYSDTVMTEFTAAFLCNPYQEPVEMFILPALTSDPNKRFPFLALLHSLYMDKFNSGRLINDSWLLHSILTLEPPGFAKLLQVDSNKLPHNRIVLEYLKIVAKLTVNVCNKQITYDYEDSLYSQETAADNDDDSDSDSEPNPTSIREQMLLTKCIELLNEPDRCIMTTCSQITDGDLCDEFLDSMSKICHNLLLSHRMALHKYRLLYTLAFKPIFLRELWQWLSNMSHESSFGGSATPLLSALSRGMGADTLLYTLAFKPIFLRELWQWFSNMSHESSFGGSATPLLSALSRGMGADTLLYTLAFKPIFLRELWQWLSNMSHESSFGGSATPLLSALSRGMGADTLLYTLAFKPIFLRELWQWLSNMSHESSFGGSATPLLSALSRGMGADTSVMGVHKLLAPLAVFCALFSLLIGTLHDTEFFRDTHGGEKNSITSPSGAATARAHAFAFSELGGLCRTLKQVCLGLVELAYPEYRPSVVGQYKDAVGSCQLELTDRNQTPAWAHLFKVCTQLLRALYARDARLGFCGAQPGGAASDAWIAAGPAVPGDGAEAVLAAVRAPRSARPYRAYVPRLTHTDHDNMFCSFIDDGPPLTIKELRTVTILREIPFVVPFSTRVLIFQGLLIREKHEHWYEMTNFNEGPSIIISVRRTHLYEDAFDKLSPENEPDLKLKLRVQLINQAGADELGVDGGGLFREFLSELLKSAFDPNRGLFRLTKDNMLYPNPGVHLLYDDFPMHYFFVGRILGKALYENLLVELPLAEFFLAKICSTREPDVHALASLDPALYRGLLMLKSHRREDVQDLGLDFTIVSDELGEQRIEELKPGGANIPVTAENRIEYIHLVADYKLNRQIRAQCNAFKRGLTSVVNAEWLRMFSCRELQLLISGAEVPIDIDDLRTHTQYGGGFSNTHPTVQCFWRVLENFTDEQRRQLLKFVTSCSRPPLLGFKDLQPPFCIQSAGATDRLPSASTCMNLLKIPEYHSDHLMAEKLLYAIQSNAGFELS